MPESLFDLLIIVAKSKGYKEETLYLFLYETLKKAYPEDMQKLIDVLGEPWPPPD
jgi:hypothetical protein